MPATPNVPATGRRATSRGRGRRPRRAATPASSQSACSSRTLGATKPPMWTTTTAAVCGPMQRGHRRRVERHRRRIAVDEAWRGRRRRGRRRPWRGTCWPARSPRDPRRRRSAGRSRARSCRRRRRRRARRRWRSANSGFEASADRAEREPTGTAAPRRSSRRISARSSSGNQIDAAGTCCVRKGAPLFTIAEPDKLATRPDRAE